MSKEDIGKVSEFPSGQGLELQNTRLRKNKSSPDSFDFLVASIENLSAVNETVYHIPESGTKVRLIYGDHAKILSKVCTSLSSALEHVRNDQETQYLQMLSEYFRTGSFQSQKEGSFAWVDDASQPVETVMGFMEPYRDSSSIRREWMDLVAIKIREQSQVLNVLASEVEKFILWIVSPTSNPFPLNQPKSPTGQVLSFCVWNCWTGITGPNFPDIRAVHGRKNTYFCNRAAAVNLSNEIPFLLPSDLEEYRKLRGLGFTTIVAIHELIGYG
ncbi:uncharacterized protein RSE6_09207 [Rhynchosporium secalis]|uniref:Uncharacterized protein n=1 Tax=Rhynchosporium secalis TaxID=38038 RepID=A0A1E1MHE3_RHYSE|nr:uncharacterized protein RSE6_09207 [Rhynchosporium secalis]